MRYRIKKGAAETVYYTTEDCYIFESFNDRSKYVVVCWIENQDLCAVCLVEVYWFKIN